MRSSTSTLVIFIIITVAACSVPATRSLSTIPASSDDPSYIMVGGQNGTWFKPEQAPRLEKIELSNYSVTPLTPAPTEGTVWGGGWNGSQWLISGWGEDLGPNGSNPYIFLYNGQSQVAGGSLNEYTAETTWHGGDIFAASADRNEWLLSGLGSGNLTSYGEINHMSLSLFNGSDFSDLSSSVPGQRDAILYANAWNGEYWLVGGGYRDYGTLFTFDGKKIVDLTSTIAQAVPSFGSVQSLAWNGYYWLIGGEDFLAKYDGHRFTDLTPELNTILMHRDDCCSSVNAIVWDAIDGEWVLGGGTPIAETDYSNAWLVKYAAGTFTDLTSKISARAADFVPKSSILSIAVAGGSWILGGYSDGQGWLYEYSAGLFTNLSYLVSSYTYVNWVGAYSFQRHIPTFARPSGVGSGESTLFLLSSESSSLETIRPRNALV